MLTIGKLAAAAGVRTQPPGGIPVVKPVPGRALAGRLDQTLTLVITQRVACCGDVRKRAIEKKRQLEGKIRSMRAMCKALDRLIACIERILPSKIGRAHV